MVSLHPTLGRSQALADFLSPTYVIAEKSGRKGLFAKLAESFAGSSQPAKVPLRDIEEFFQNERDWSANYSIHLKTTLNAVLTVIHSEKSNENSFEEKLDHIYSCTLLRFPFLKLEIIGQLKHLCTALSMNAPTSYQQETSRIHHQLHSKMADSFLTIQVHCYDRFQTIRSIDVSLFACYSFPTVSGSNRRRTSKRFMRFLLHLGSVSPVLSQRTADAQPTYGIAHQLRERQPQLG